MTDETHIKGDFIQGDKVAGDKHEHHYTPPQFPLIHLPPPNPNFSGRAALLNDIRSAFQTPQSQIAITQAIAGLGGVGKTQLALAYAHAHREEYDLIWQLQADDAAVLDNDLRGLGLALRLPVRDVDAPTARRLVLSWLNGSDQRWLLLYDNADRMGAGDLRPYLPGGGGHALITSRRPHWPGAQVVRLDVFTADEAAAFWLKRIGRKMEIEEEEALAQLAGELGRLPLALEQAAAYMARRQKTAAQYLALYRARRRELWARQPPPDDYEKTVTTTWEIAFEQAQATPGAAALLNLCCFLAPDDIPLALITAQAEALPGELAAADELALDDALAALGAYSLLRREGEMLAVHRLVQTVARDRMGEERARKWAEAAVKLLHKAYRFDQHDMNTWAQCGQLLPHVTTAANLAEKWNVRDKQAAFLNNEAGFYLQHYGDHAGARPYYERALAILEAKLGPDHPHTNIVRRNLQSLS